MDTLNILAIREAAAAFREKQDAEMLYGRVGTLEALLAEESSWKPNLGRLKHIKPGHGPCCTCQTCGHHHDDCVCRHNEIEDRLAAWPLPENCSTTLAADVARLCDRVAYLEAFVRRVSVDCQCCCHEGWTSRRMHESECMAYLGKDALEAIAGTLGMSPDELNPQPRGRDE
jgi:hypothetical protein